MYGSDFIRVYDDAIPEDLCDELVKLHKAFQEDGITRTGPVVGGYSPFMKISEAVQVRHGPEELLARAKEAIRQTRERYFRDVGVEIASHLTFVESDPQVQRYPQGTGFYREHVDQSPNVVMRNISFVGFLNDIEEGGDTYFINQDVSASPKRGRMVVFPPFWMFPHEGRKPITDDKYILITIQDVEEITC